MYIVTLRTTAGRFFLRQTIWSFSEDRAQQFDSREAAMAQLVKAKPFMKAAAFKGATIIEQVAA